MVFLYSWPISARIAWIIVVGSGFMADSDPVAVWVVDDSGQHQVLDEFVSTREAVDRQIDEVVALCAYEARWTMEVIRINGDPLRLVGVAVPSSRATDISPPEARIDLCGDALRNARGVDTRSTLCRSAGERNDQPRSLDTPVTENPSHTR